MKRVLVFGGNGIVGRALCQQLSSNYQVISLDNTPDIRSSVEDKDFETRFVDILDFDQVKNVLLPNDIVINLAAMSRISDCNKNRLDAASINLIGPINIMEAAAERKVERLILASSLYANGKFGGFYSASKRAMEQYALTYSAITALPLTILRLGSIAGYLDDTNSLPTRIIRRLLDLDSGNLKVNQRILRDYLPLKGITKGIEDVILSPQYINCAVEFFTGSPISVDSLISKVLSVAKVDTLNFIELIEKEDDFADQYVTDHTSDCKFELCRIDISNNCENLDGLLMKLYKDGLNA